MIPILLIVLGALLIYAGIRGYGIGNLLRGKLA